MPKHSGSTGKLASYLTITEAARLIGVTAMTLRRWDKTGKLKPRRHPMNSYRLYKRDELLAVLKAVDRPAQKRKG
jgi:excisionase family DNA binding protein